MSLLQQICVGQEENNFKGRYGNTITIINVYIFEQSLVTRVTNYNCYCLPSRQ